MMLWYVQRTARSTQNKNCVWWEAGCFFLGWGDIWDMWTSSGCHYLSRVSSPSQRIRNENVTQVCLLSVIISPLLQKGLASITSHKMLKTDLKENKSLTSPKIINQDELWDKISLCPDKKSDWCFEKSFNPTKSELNGKLSNALSNRHI